MALERQIVVQVDKATITKAGDKIGITFKEVSHRTIYLNISEFGQDFTAGTKYLITVVESQNKDKTMRLDVKAIEEV